MASCERAVLPISLLMNFHGGVWIGKSAPICWGSGLRAEKPARTKGDSLNWTPNTSTRFQLKEPPDEPHSQTLHTSWGPFSSQFSPLYKTSWVVTFSFFQKPWNVLLFFTWVMMHQWMKEKWGHKEPVPPSFQKQTVSLALWLWEKKGERGGNPHCHESLSFKDLEFLFL